MQFRVTLPEVPPPKRQLLSPCEKSDKLLLNSTFDQSREFVAVFDLSFRISSFPTEEIQVPATRGVTVPPIISYLTTINWINRSIRRRNRVAGLVRWIRYQSRDVLHLGGGGGGIRVRERGSGGEEGGHVGGEKTLRRIGNGGEPEEGEKWWGGGGKDE